MPLNRLLAKETFDPARTRVICDAFEAAWKILQKSRSRFTEPALSSAARTILAKRILEMARDRAIDQTDLRNDALEHLHKHPPASKSIPVIFAP